ncbi:MAG: hypothetical protein JWN08_1722, partial [Frankiales bacterium]|nr:hypothetical protein [Frankiales bacterium]
SVAVGAAGASGAACSVATSSEACSAWTVSGVGLSAVVMLLALGVAEHPIRVRLCRPFVAVCGSILADRPPGRQDRPGQTVVVRPRDPFTVVLVLVLYVLPLTATAVLLAVAGLPWIALALLVVEAGVAAAVVVAERPPRPSAGPRPGWLVPAAFAAVLAGLVGLTLVAARSG